ncbi:MAG: hypothetical protein QXH30_03090 [Candidatus Bilamarchaeaceae archaeon]
MSDGPKPPLPRPPQAQNAQAAQPGSPERKGTALPPPVPRPFAKKALSSALVKEPSSLNRPFSPQGKPIAPKKPEKQAQAPYRTPAQHQPSAAHDLDLPIPIGPLPESKLAFSSGSVSQPVPPAQESGREKDGSLPDFVDIDLSELERKSLLPTPAAAIAELEKRLPGENLREAIRILRFFLPIEKKFAELALEGDRIMLDGNEVGAFFPEGSASFKIWMGKIGIKMDREAFPYEAALQEFKAYNADFLRRAVSSSEDACICFNGKGVTLQFYKDRNGQPTHIFPKAISNGSGRE